MGSSIKEQRPSTRGGGLIDYDAVSHTSNAYVGNHAKGKNRQMSAQTRKVKLGNHLMSPGKVSLVNSKTYYPDGYFKRVGYQVSEAGSRVDALGQRVRDRFNEELDVDEPKKQSGGIHSRTLKQLKQSNFR